MADAPDIDGLVYLSQPEGLSVGDIVTARILEPMTMIFLHNG